MEKKSNGSKACIAILVILVLVLGGYIIYDKLLNRIIKPVEDTPKPTVSAVHKYDLSNRTTAQAVRGEYLETLVDTTGNVYLYTIGNAEGEGIETLKNQYQKYSPKGYESIGDSEFKAVKLNLSNVLSAYYVHVGNGGFTYFVFVTEGGNVAFLNYDKVVSEGKAEAKLIANIKNVVSIVDNTNTMSPYAVDANGKEISLIDYIK